MGEKFQKKEGMLKANSLEFADSIGENHSEGSYKHTYFSPEQKAKQDIIERKEKTQADDELERKLANLDSIFGTEIETDLVEKGISRHEEHLNDLDVKDKIKSLNTKMLSEGKPPTEILQTLLNTYGKEESIPIWIKNWKNFQRLHDFAKSKPPQEQQAIESILMTADFTSESSFENTLVKISESEDISKETKKEIALKFGRGGVKSVKHMDTRLKDMKRQNERCRKNLKTEEVNQEKLKDKIQSLKSKLDDPELDSSDRLKLEEEQKILKEKLDQNKKEIEKLKTSVKEKISFPIRKGFSARLSTKGTRYIESTVNSISIHLPTNRLPFTAKANLDSVNFCFLLNALKENGLDQFLIKPNFQNGSIPSRTLRFFSNRIIKALGLKNGIIMNDESINTLSNSISILTKVYSTKSPYENLKALGIIDPKQMEMDKGRLMECLTLIGENQNTEAELLKERLITFSSV